MKFNPKMCHAWRRVLAAASLCFIASLATTASATSLVIQPIKICNDAGVSCANDAENLFLAETNKIWAQAGIDFTYLSFTTTNSTVLQILDNQPEVDLLFSTAPGAAADPLTISMWFVLSHFDAWGEVNAIGGNKIVIDQAIFTVNRLDTIAHEVGHLLGLLHTDPGVDVDFLMRTGVDRTTPTVITDITPDGAGLDKLTAAQIATALLDPKVLDAAVTAVPEPTTFTMILFGLGGLGLVARRRNGRGA